MEMKINMLSRDCDSCGQMRECKKRFKKPKYGIRCIALSGETHLIDGASLNY